MQQLFAATLKAGILPALIAPIIWPVVVFVSEGKFPDWSSYPGALVPIAFFALIIGVLCCISIGIPTLMILQRIKMNKPIIAAIAGFIFGVVLFLIFGPGFEQALINKSWPIFIFVGVLGAICGFVASRLSRPNKSLKPTPNSSAA